MPFLWHIRPTAAAEGVRHSTVDPSIKDEGSEEAAMLPDRCAGIPRNAHLHARDSAAEVL
jgi:hypothetical protein